jgi:hypothetical protein
VPVGTGIVFGGVHLNGNDSKKAEARPLPLPPSRSPGSSPSDPGPRPQRPIDIDTAVAAARPRLGTAGPWRAPGPAPGPRFSSLPSLVPRCDFVSRALPAPLRPALRRAKRSVCICATGLSCTLPFACLWLHAAGGSALPSLDDHIKLAREHLGDTWFEQRSTKETKQCYAHRVVCGVQKVCNNNPKT